MSLTRRTGSGIFRFRHARRLESDIEREFLRSILEQLVLDWEDSARQMRSDPDDYYVTTEQEVWDGQADVYAECAKALRQRLTLPRDAVR